MNEQEIKKLWQSASEKGDESLIISKQNQKDISNIQVYNLLASMKPIKIFTLLVGILWVGIGGIVLTNIFLFAFEDANKFFLFSAGIQVALTAIGIIIYLYQLIAIYQIDITEPILKTQKRIAKLKSSTLWVTRILILQLPVWTTFWWNDSMLQNWDLWQWFIVLIFTVSFTVTALWLFFNIKFENREKEWFKLIFNGKEWTPLMQSMELLEQIEEYTHPDKTDTQPVSHS
jgi:hypothetical protein